MKKHVLVFISFLAGLNAFPQSTYTMVYNLFQAQCTAGCHSGTSPDAQLNLSGTPSSVYHNVVNKEPVNTTALNKGDKLIMPGYPHRSFLLRKCDNALNLDNAISSEEGALMPDASSPMQKKDIELIRQWILNGAPQNGNPVDTAIINKYYRGKGFTSPAAPFPKPTATGSFQIHVGKFFVAPASEFQFYLKRDPNLQDTVEVYRLDAMLGDRAHHFNMLKFSPGTASNFNEGMRGLLETSHLGSTVIAAFQHSYNLDLPEGTAYQWEAGIVLDINFHIVNPNQDSVLAVDLYINVYTQPKGTARDIMKIKWYSNFALAIPWDSKNHEFTAVGSESEPTGLWDVWMMSSHTHKYGTDFDVYLRNPDGSEGDQVYEGDYNAEYTFNQGFYDWQHPARRYFEPFLTVDPNDGFIFKTTFDNTDGPPLIFWGATAADEMAIMYIHYIEKREPTGLESKQAQSFGVNIFPNPAKGRSQISYTLPEGSKVSIEIVNTMGDKVVVICSNEFKLTGSQTQSFNLPTESGVYFAKLIANDHVEVKQFIVAE